MKFYLAQVVSQYIEPYGDGAPNIFLKRYLKKKKKKKKKKKESTTTQLWILFTKL